VALIVDKMRENRLTWFEHIMSTGDSEVDMKINVEGKRGREGLRKG